MVVFMAWMEQSNWLPNCVELQILDQLKEMKKNENEKNIPAPGSLNSLDFHRV